MSKKVLHFICLYDIILNVERQTTYFLIKEIEKMIKAYIEKKGSCEIQLNGGCGDVLEELAILTSKICQAVADETGDNFDNVFSHVRKAIKIQRIHDEIQDVKKDNKDNVNNPSSIFEVLLKAIEAIEELETIDK